VTDLARELPDAELAQRILAVDPLAEQEFADRFRSRVFAVALARLGDFDAAEDVTQQALLKALEALRAGRLEQPHKLGAYLCGTARHLASKHLRTRRRDSGQKPEGEISAEDGPEERLCKSEHSVLAARALRHLAVIDQKILMWTLTDGLTSVEIGNRLNRSPASVRQRKLRALRRARADVLSMSRKEPPGD
jgi:RNA polymerase sigma-70 factor (ECF subfamily)